MVVINNDTCIGCGQCVRDCFPDNLEMVEGKASVKNESCILCGHCVAVCPVNAVSIKEYDMDEVKEYNPQTFTIHEEHLLNFIKYRRSVRHFKPMQVENEKLEKIIEAGRYTQTGRNLQDVSYTVIKENIEEFRGLVLERLNLLGQGIIANLNEQTMAYKPYADLWLTMYKEYKEGRERRDKLFFNAKAIILVSAQSEVSGALASSNMELMTNALGLGTFFSGFTVRALQDNPKIRQYLGINESDKVVTCMVIGYPDVKYYRTAPRKESEIKWL